SQAYRAATALVRATSAGPWVRLYSFTSMLVLNAQLQAALSIADYAKTSGSPDAAVFATRLEQAAVALLPRFDTGAWSLYALGGAEAPLKYHSYVVSLLERLAQRTQSPAWADAWARFDSYLALPPDVAPLATTGVVYPLPRDGFRDRASVTFSLSKKSTMRFVVAGEQRPFTLPRGRHTLSWNPGRRAPRRYAARLVATDLAGNTTELPLPAIEVRRDTEPPAVAALVQGRTLTWDVFDEGTPWLHLTVVVERGRTRTRLELGRRGFKGSYRLPQSGVAVQLVVADSAGNRTTVAL
ncbi:MAG: D-glucuronyl C5-epimerase family protein, partial [Actinomycetota bacterium]|nr:D-glucuronyl C5-epimerase family protein [Actinomycetota bacterium]